MASTLDSGFQVGESAEADFERSTWTFNMSGNYRVSAGHFAILRTEAFMAMSTRLATAEHLLAEWRDGDCPKGLDNGFKDWRERLEKFFEPEPL